MSAVLRRCTHERILFFDRNTGLLQERKRTETDGIHNNSFYYEKWYKALKNKIPELEVHEVELAAEKMKVGDSLATFVTLVEKSVNHKVKFSRHYKENAFEKRKKEYRLTPEEVLGVVQFEFYSNDTIKADVLICDYPFEEIQKMEKELFQLIVNKLEKNRTFKSIGVPINFWQVKLIYRKNLLG